MLKPELVLYLRQFRISGVEVDLYIPRMRNSTSDGKFFIGTYSGSVTFYSNLAIVLWITMGNRHEHYEGKWRVRVFASPLIMNSILSFFFLVLPFDDTIWHHTLMLCYVTNHFNFSVRQLTLWNFQKFYYFKDANVTNHFIFNVSQFQNFNHFKDVNVYWYH